MLFLWRQLNMVFSTFFGYKQTFRDLNSSKRQQYTRLYCKILTIVQDETAIYEETNLEIDFQAFVANFQTFLNDNMFPDLEYIQTQSNSKYQGHETIDATTTDDIVSLENVKILLLKVLSWVMLLLSSHTTETQLNKISINSSYLLELIKSYLSSANYHLNIDDFNECHVPANKDKLIQFQTNIGCYKLILHILCSVCNYSNATILNNESVEQLSQMIHTEKVLIFESLSSYLISYYNLTTTNDQIASLSTYKEFHRDYFIIQSLTLQIITNLQMTMTIIPKSINTIQIFLVNVFQAMIYSLGIIIHNIKEYSSSTMKVSSSNIEYSSTNEVKQCNNGNVNDISSSNTTRNSYRYNWLTVFDTYMKYLLEVLHACDMINTTTTHSNSDISYDNHITLLHQLQVYIKTNINSIMETINKSLLIELASLSYNINNFNSNSTATAVAAVVRNLPTTSNIEIGPYKEENTRINQKYQELRNGQLYRLCLKILFSCTVCQTNNSNSTDMNTMNDIINKYLVPNKQIGVFSTPIHKVYFTYGALCSEPKNTNDQANAINNQSHIEINEYNNNLYRFVTGLYEISLFLQCLANQLVLTCNQSSYNYNSNNLNQNNNDGKTDKMNNRNSHNSHNNTKIQHWSQYKHLIKFFRNNFHSLFSPILAKQFHQRNSNNNSNENNDINDNNDINKNDDEIQSIYYRMLQTAVSTLHLLICNLKIHHNDQTSNNNFTNKHLNYDETLQLLLSIPNTNNTVLEHNHGCEYPLLNVLVSDITLPLNFDKNKPTSTHLISNPIKCNSIIITELTKMEIKRFLCYGDLVLCILKPFHLVFSSQYTHNINHTNNTTNKLNSIHNQQKINIFGLFSHQSNSTSILTNIANNVKNNKNNNRENIDGEQYSHMLPTNFDLLDLYKSTSCQPKKIVKKLELITHVLLQLQTIYELLINQLLHHHNSKNIHKTTSNESDIEMNKNNKNNNVDITFITEFLIDYEQLINDYVKAWQIGLTIIANYYIYNQLTIQNKNINTKPINNTDMTNHKTPPIDEVNCRNKRTKSTHESSMNKCASHTANSCNDEFEIKEVEEEGINENDICDMILTCEDDDDINQKPYYVSTLLLTSENSQTDGENSNTNEINYESMKNIVQSIYTLFHQVWDKINIFNICTEEKLSVITMYIPSYCHNTIFFWEIYIESMFWLIHRLSAYTLTLTPPVSISVMPTMAVQSDDMHSNETNKTNTFQHSLIGTMIQIAFQYANMYDAYINFLNNNNNKAFEVSKYNNHLKSYNSRKNNLEVHTNVTTETNNFHRSYLNHLHVLKWSLHRCIRGITESGYMFELLEWLKNYHFLDDTIMANKQECVCHIELNRLNASKMNSKNVPNAYINILDYPSNSTYETQIFILFIKECIHIMSQLIRNENLDLNHSNIKNNNNSNLSPNKINIKLNQLSSSPVSNKINETNKNIHNINKPSILQLTPDTSQLVKNVVDILIQLPFMLMLNGHTEIYQFHKKIISPNQYYNHLLLVKSQHTHQSTDTSTNINVNNNTNTNTNPMEMGSSSNVPISPNPKSTTTTASTSTLEFDNIEFMNDWLQLISIWLHFKESDTIHDNNNTSMTKCDMNDLCSHWLPNQCYLNSTQNYSCMLLNCRPSMIFNTKHNYFNTLSNDNSKDKNTKSTNNTSITNATTNNTNPAMLEFASTLRLIIPTARIVETKHKTYFENILKLQSLLLIANNSNINESNAYSNIITNTLNTTTNNLIKNNNNNHHNPYEYRSLLSPISPIKYTIQNHSNQPHTNHHQYTPYEHDTYTNNLKQQLKENISLYTHLRKIGIELSCITLNTICGFCATIQTAAIYNKTYIENKILPMPPINLTTNLTKDNNKNKISSLSSSSSLSLYTTLIRAFDSIMKLLVIKKQKGLGISSYLHHAYDHIEYNCIDMNYYNNNKSNSSSNICDMDKNMNHNNSGCNKVDTHQNAVDSNISNFIKTNLQYDFISIVMKNNFMNSPQLSLFENNISFPNTTTTKHDNENNISNIIDCQGTLLTSIFEIFFITITNTIPCLTSNLLQIYNTSLCNSNTENIENTEEINHHLIVYNDILKACLYFFKKLLETIIVLHTNQNNTRTDIMNTKSVMNNNNSNNCNNNSEIKGIIKSAMKFIEKLMKYETLIQSLSYTVSTSSSSWKYYNIDNDWNEVKEYSEVFWNEMIAKYRSDDFQQEFKNFPVISCSSVHQKASNNQSNIYNNEINPTTNSSSSSSSPEIIYMKVKGPTLQQHLSNIKISGKKVKQGVVPITYTLADRMNLNPLSQSQSQTQTSQIIKLHSQSTLSPTV